MKKILISLAILVIVLFGGGYLLLFTQAGNNLLLPTINSYLDKKVDGAKIDVTSFTLSPSHLKADATINSVIDINADGDFDIFKKSVDMIYTVNAKKIDTPEFKLDEKIYIKGKIIGDMGKSLIFGVGKLGNSPLEYKLNLVDNNPQNITIKIQEADLDKLLIVAGQKPYATGKINLLIDMPNITTGEAKVDITNGILNSNLLKKDFQIELAKNSKFETHINALIKEKIVNFNSKNLTSLCNILTSNGSYNLVNKKLSSNYNLDIKNLADLKSITKQNFKGQFRANGIIKQNNKNTFVSLNTKSFGGKSEIYYSGDKLKVLLKKVNSKTLLYKLNQPSYIDSKISSNIDITSIKKLTGSYTLNLDGVLNKQIIKKLHKIDLPMGNKINLNSNGNLKNNKVFSKAKLITTLGAIKLDDFIFNMAKNSIESLNATTKIIGGSTFVELKNNKLSILLKNISSKKVLKLLNQPIHFNGLINSNINIDDIKKLNGKFDLIASGILNPSLLEGNQKLNLKTNGTLSNSIVSIPTAFLKSKLFNLIIKKLSYDLKKSQLKASYHVSSDDLSTLNKITNQKLKGSLKVDGDIKMQKDLIVKGHSDKFDGAIDFVLKNSNLSATVKDASILKITKTLSYPKYLEGVANADFKYNLKTSKGLANIYMNKAKLLPSKITSIITRLKGIDLTKEHFNKTTLQARLSKNLIDFDFDAKSRSAMIDIKNGKIYQPEGKLDALLNVSIEGDKYKAKIYGTTSNPKLKLDSSALRAKAKEKVKKKIKQKINDEIKKRLKLDKIDKEKVIKGIFKKLF